MGIQSSINSLLSQAQRLTTFYKGYKKAEDFVGDQEIAKNEAQIQTDIAAGNAPMKDGKVDPEWLKKRREKYNSDMLTSDEKQQAQDIYNKSRKGIELDSGEKQFYNNPIIQDYIKSFEKSSKIIKNEINRNNDPSLADVLAKYGTKNAALDSAINAQSQNSELKNEVARKVAKISVKSRTNNINKTKADFKKHLIGVKKDKGSELN